MTTYFLLISIQALLWQCGWSQTSARHFQLGLYLYEQASYYDAVTEFYKVIFLDGAKAEKAKTYYQIGLCEREMKNWQKSFHAFNSSLNLTEHDSLRQEINLAIASNHLATGNFALADLKLLKIIASPNNTAIEKEARLLFLISSILQKKWTAASRQVEHISYLRADSIKYQAFVSEISKAVSFPKKSRQKARRFSTFLPGAGQLYAEDYRNSLNAFLLNGANVALNTMLFTHRYYVDGFLYLLTITERYYNGNRYQAGQSVRKREQTYDQKVQEKLLDIIGGQGNAAG